MDASHKRGINMPGYVCGRTVSAKGSERDRPDRLFQGDDNRQFVPRWGRQCFVSGSGSRGLQPYKATIASARRREL